MNYSERLRDPRWQKKRLEIMQRDNFTCRYCQSTTNTLNVHHKHYLKGRDPWDYPNDSLITLCEKCHEKVHLTSLKPAIVRNVYLAGKIAYHDWRHTLVQGLRNIDFWQITNLTRRDGVSGKGVIGVVRGGHNYTGPFFIGCDHGCAHGKSHHGLHLNGCTESSLPHSFNWGGGRATAFELAKKGIESCDVFFAWIESTDCYGTLVEIGYAAALKHPIILVGFKKDIDDLWFARKFATASGFYVDAEEAFQNLFPA